MARSRGTVAVAAAISGNFSIAVLKLAGFFASGSSALFSEAIHSFADTANQSLLLFGIHQSKRKADEHFSYGYGGERFLWALISACGIFFLGAGVTIYHGIEALQHPQVARINPMIFGILAVSFLVESVTLYLAVRELRSHDAELSFAELLKEGDPATLAVVYEDSVAIVGVGVAAVGIALTYLTGNPFWDAFASIVVGACLGIVAVILINKNRLFLIGKSIPRGMKEDIIEMLEKEPHIKRVLEFRSTVLDVGHYHVKCEIEWNGAALLKLMMQGEDLEETYREVTQDYTEFKRYLAYTANRVPRLMGRIIDEIEQRIITEFPEIDYIDIEIN
ncbi:cation diffusion facilitator family transporter [Candidatus Kaiserbacteria bacterium]|nr:cation diffusion facilitator family transporter [Candidatus Kaiserbacteria bacterium]